MNKIGFIGGGNMGGALAGAAVKTLGKENVLVVDRDEASTAACAARIGATAASYEQIARECRLIFLAVKPNLVGDVAKTLVPLLSDREGEMALVSMAAGVPLSTLGAWFGDDAHIIRIMPNTPAQVGEGMIVYACSDSVTDGDKTVFAEAMSEAGRLDAIDECKIDAATGVMGCGPAYAYQFIEALADGGVACGLTRAQAQLYAAQTLLGAAQMVLSTGKHPGELKDAVCSPGGSTIQGVRVLEEGGLRGTVIDAVIAAYDKTKELGK
jgi:pyrroline-5-carboxylate reductase